MKEQPAYGPADRSRVELTDSPAVRWWCRTLGVSESQLREAVRLAGPDIAAVRRQLGQGRD